MAAIIGVSIDLDLIKSHPINGARMALLIVAAMDLTYRVL